MNLFDFTWINLINIIDISFIINIITKKISIISKNESTTHNRHIQENKNI